MEDLKIITQSQLDNQSTKESILELLQKDQRTNQLLALANKFEPVEYAVLEYYTQQEKNKKNNIISILWWLVKASPKIVSLISQLIKLIGALKMNNDNKTTFVATVKILMGIVAMALSLFGFNIPEDVNQALIGIAGAAYLVFSWIQGFFTNKKNDDEKNTNNK